jgi:RNA polymerase sigma factor (sigma-70 family)
VRETASVEFEWVFRSAYPSVLRTVVLILHDRGLAEQVTQDSFLKLCERWPRLAGVDNPTAWVRKVAVRAAIRLAQRNRRVLVGIPADPAQRAEGWPDVDLQRAVAALPVRQRAAVVLHYLEDLSVQDVASVLGVSSSTVKQHLHRARATLAETLGEKSELHVEEVNGDVG